ncbi:hypothetical protein EW146_g3743 [Bondarzewia mesenterica]|uniref:Uncharacterized protein n=1 Tax=Bondarzewia mesenterica TaxID=1095465 RepID=A0A4V3XFC3_9AGAM|nr:hypothetical protein EW146_g3743 [Bondarzewia mesenterica]
MPLALQRAKTLYMEPCGIPPFPTNSQIPNQTPSIQASRAQMPNQSLLVQEQPEEQPVSVTLDICKLVVSRVSNVILADAHSTSDRRLLGRQTYRCE